MERNHTTETVFGISAATTGLGILTFALFPLVLPILILTVAALVPLLAVGAILAIPVALIAAVVLGIGAIGRRVGGRRASVRADERQGRPLSTVAHSG